MLPCFVSTRLCHESNIPLVGSISVMFHGKWDNLTFSRVSSRLAADVITFFENCKPVAACGFSNPDPLRTIFAILVIISFLFGGSAFRIVTRPMTLEKLL